MSTKIHKKYFKNRTQWRNWLQKNHNSADSVWLIYYKKNSEKESVSYNDAVEEAICFGWIDGQVKGIDEEKFMQRYTPRRKGSIWSESNIKRAKKMIKQGKMRKAGLEKFEKMIMDDQKGEPVRPARLVSRIPKDFKLALSKNRKAEQKFDKFPKSHKQRYYWWIVSAKRNETRERRIREAIMMILKNK